MTEQKTDELDVHHKTKQSVVWYTTLPFVMHFLRFANSLLLARILAPSDFGIIGIITVIMYYSDTFCDFGFSKAIIQRKKVEQAHYFSFFSFNLTISILFFSVFQLFAPDIAKYFEVPELEAAIQAFTFVLLITAVSSVAMAKLRRELQFKALAIIEAVKIFSSMVISLTLALNGFGFWSLIIAMLASQVIALIPILIVARMLPRPYWGLKYLKQLVKFGKWDFFGGQIKLVAENVDKLIIGKVLGTTQLGFYDKALGLAKMPYEQISGKMANVSFSSFSRVQEDEAQLQYYFSKIVALNALLLMPLLFGLAAVAESFVLSLLGEKWQPMIRSLELFSFSFVLASLTSPITSMNFAANKIKPQTIINFVLTSLLLVAMLYWVKAGVEAVAITIMVFNLFMFLSSFVLLNWYSGIGWGHLLQNLLPATLFSAVMFSAIKLLQYTVEFSSSWSEFVLSVVVGIVVYGVCLMVIPFRASLFMRDKVIKLLRKTGVGKLVGA